MKKVTLFVVLVLSFSMIACSKNPQITVPETTPCLKYYQSSYGDNQTLTNPIFQAHFKDTLSNEFAEQNLRICTNNETSEYSLNVTEISADYQDAGLRPSLIPSGNPLFDVVSGVFTYVTVNGSKALYRAAIQSDSKIRYTASVSHEKKTRWLIRDDRPHYKEMDEDVADDIQEHYSEFAIEIVSEIAELRETTDVK